MKDITKYRSSPLDVFDEMRRSFQSFFDEIPGWSRMPAMDVKQEENRYIVEAEVPGLTEKDIDVTVTDSALRISSNKEDEREEKEEGYLVRERRHMAFNRNLMLPEDADREHIDAQFRNGILNITIPRKEQQKKKEKRIDIKKS